MPCFHPIVGQRNPYPNENGKHEYLFAPAAFKATEANEHLPCGRCIGCRLEYSRQWAIRCMHESRLHDENCFITLTYDEENLPSPPVISKQEWRKFNNSLRKKLSRLDKPVNYRFFMAGEYGDRTERPHYHALIFGWRPQDDDLEPLQKNHQGDIIYNSKMLSKLWGKGKVDVGELTFESAAYCARYATKKVNGKLKKQGYYQRVDLETGECYELEPEFALMSNKPGIGKDFYHKYKSDFDKGYITVNGNKVPITKYYNRLFEEEDPDRYAVLKEQKTEFARSFFQSEESDKKRRAVSEHLKQKSLKRLKRGIDSDEQTKHICNP